MSGTSLVHSPRPRLNSRQPSSQIQTKRVEFKLETSVSFGKEDIGFPQGVEKQVKIREEFSSKASTPSALFHEQKLISPQGEELKVKEDSKVGEFKATFEEHPPKNNNPVEKLSLFNPSPSRSINIAHFVEVPQRFERVPAPISKMISPEEKSNLDFYYKHDEKAYERNFSRIRDIFSTLKHKEVLLKSINTIQALIKEGKIYHTAINAIKNKLYFSLVGDTIPKISKGEISDFVDKVVMLARFQPRCFSFPEKTKSIEKLLVFLECDSNSDDLFKDSKTLNEPVLSEYTKLLKGVELSDMVSLPRPGVSYVPSIKLDTPQATLKPSDVRTNKVTSESKEKIERDTDLSKMSFYSVLKIFLSHFSIDEILKSQTLVIHKKEHKDGISHIKIELVDLISRENILLSTHKNFKIFFIARKEGETLVLHPYSPESFGGTLEVGGLTEQTTHLPIRFAQDGDNTAQQGEKYFENSWVILPKYEFKELLKVH